MVIRQQDFRILVVDDDDSIRMIVKELLDHEGYQVVTARDGQEALQQVEDARPDLILLDAIMPVANGRDFAAELLRRGEQIPVVMMTASPFASIWARDVGAADYLPKPFDTVELLDLIERYRARVQPAGDDSAPVQ